MVKVGDPVSFKRDFPAESCVLHLSLEQINLEQFFLLDLIKKLGS